MRFHGRYCHICKEEQLFLEKLVNVKNPNCREKEDVCMICKNSFYIKNETHKNKRLKLRQ